MSLDVLTSDTRPPWLRAKWLAAVVLSSLATIVLLFANKLGAQLDPSAQAILASTIPAAIALFQLAEGKSDVARADASARIAEADAHAEQRFAGMSDA